MVDENILTELNHPVSSEERVENRQPTFNHSRRTSRYLIRNDFVVDDKPGRKDYVRSTVFDIEVATGT